VARSRGRVGGEIPVRGDAVRMHDQQRALRERILELLDLAHLVPEVPLCETMLRGRRCRDAGRDVADAAIDARARFRAAAARLAAAAPRVGRSARARRPSISRHCGARCFSTVRRRCARPRRIGPWPRPSTTNTTSEPRPCTPSSVAADVLAAFLARRRPVASASARGARLRPYLEAQQRARARAATRLRDPRSRAAARPVPRRACRWWNVRRACWR
jgi:hypothetical protein